MNKSSLAAAAAVLVVAAGAAASYWSPHITLAQIGSAIDRGDAAEVSAHVDFPALREDLKAKMAAAVSRRVDAAGLQGNALAAFGQTLAAGLANQMVDAMVTPGAVAVMLDTGKAVLPTRAATPAPAAPPAQPAPAARSDVGKRHYEVHYLDYSLVRVQRQGQESGLLFRREGLFDWKLVGVDLAP